VRARRAKARKRLPSSREPASVNPQIVHKGNLLGTLAHAHRFAFCPSAPRISGATDFFLASALSWSPTGLATSRWRRRAMRPTDFCHPNELRAPAPRAFPARSRSFRCGDAPRRLRLRAVNRGTGRFTTSKTASADRQFNTALELYCLTAWRHERGRFLPTVLMATEPLTPLSQSPSFHPHASLAFASAATWPYVRLLNGLVRVGGCGDCRDHRWRLLVKADAS
jgi:hypothetical protein